MKTMVDLIHRCFACNELAYETEVEYSDKEQTKKVYVLYECPECGFSWEVVSCGEKGFL